MSTRELYRRFLGLCQKWPKDEQKTGRDYGEVFRKQIAARFTQGELGTVESPRELDQSLKALERLANNSYYNENHLTRSSASGMEAWACKEAISNEVMNQINEEEESSVLARLKQALGMKFTTLAKHKSTTESP